MSKEVKYSREFKLDALNLQQEGKSISDISKSLGVDVIHYMETKLSKVQVFTCPKMSNKTNLGD